MVFITAGDALVVANGGDDSVHVLVDRTNGGGS